MQNAKCKKLLTQNIQEIQETMRRPNPKEDSHANIKIT
jgi:hypothetical protein